MTSLTTDERKIVTTLFADLVDSTGLAQRLDAERAREVLGRFFDVASEELRNLRGLPEKFIGDAVMAVFGAQRTSEDDALRAVRAGLAIRDRVHRLDEELGLDGTLEVRVGVESGEAATGGGPAAQLLVTGPVVNAAARLQAAAAPGELLVGEIAHQLTAAAVEYGAARHVEAKGFLEPLDAYPVERLTTRSVRRTIPFVGRAAELDELRAAFDRVKASGAAETITVVGGAGVGKSRLVDELIAAAASDARALRAQGTIAAGSETFAPVASILRELTGVEDHTPAADVPVRLRPLVEDACQTEDVPRMVASLAMLLGVADGGPPRADPTFLHDVNAGTARIVERLAADGPVILVVEDAHALAPAMLDLVERLGRTVDGPLLLVVLARPGLRDARPGWGDDVPRHRTLTLGPLALDDAKDLVRHAGGERIDDTLAGSVASRAGGNPFFIIETTGMLLADGPTPAPTVVPATVQAVVAARLDALPPETRAVARNASVFFVSFDLDEARAVLGDVDDLERRFQELEEAELFDRADDGAPRWRFRHAVLRDVAYASLPKRQRLILHTAVADVLERDGHRTWAAEHLEEAAKAAIDVDPRSRALPDRALDALVEAGHRARRRMEHGTALDRYARALALSPDPSTWGVSEARALGGMGESHYWLGEYGAATERLEQAVEVGERIDDGWTLALALRFLGDIAINVHADVDGAEKLLSRSLDAAEAIDEPYAITRTLLFAGWVPWTRHDFAEAERIWRRALELAERNDDRWSQVRALTSLSIDLGEMGDRLDEAAALIERARAIARAMGDRFSEAVATVQTGRIHSDRGEHAAAIPCLDHGIAVFEDLGVRWEMADALAARGIEFRELDRLDEAERDLEEAIRISEELGERQLASWTWRHLARVSERRGDTELAAERWRRADEAEARAPK
ncbi:MAG TPA: AAA family ATPase [Actinomycetota bacterium]|nr:AAA family ATPase [Actinomycetota bacterium]